MPFLKRYADQDLQAQMASSLWEHAHSADYSFLQVAGFGSAGWRNVRSRAQAEGVKSLPARDLEPDVARGLVAAINNLIGMDLADFTAKDVRNIGETLDFIAGLDQDEFGSYEARLLAINRRTADLQQKPIYAFDATEYVESKGHPFTQGICWDPVRPFETCLTDQTYEDSAASRLAAAWNATVSLDLVMLERQWLRDTMDLIVRCHDAAAGRIRFNTKLGQMIWDELAVPTAEKLKSLKAPYRTSARADTGLPT